ncbi:MSHA biogenesis protein MshO [Aeromonas diversa CDC 2478-85]|uniref:MSHA biogenesis protein MshO n=1 Tax=Aeromonas diversa CDC 2478-85 TaxID=1268237 RepID=N9V9R7_9GAMM|nr:type II secretion system protein [Aeromonas diversa]ENY72022.1 MSHA biogenesis protein MshO [Aeromonas diversa CDC 2478-85]
MARGFTLIELVMVILLLGIMATFSSQFIGTGTLIYQDASAREQLMSDVRFALERLNREVGQAVPGSLQIEDLDGNRTEQGACIRFWPIQSASRYLRLNQGLSGGTFAMTLVTPDGAAPTDASLAIVYPLTEQGLAQGCIGGTCTSQVLTVSPVGSGALQVTTAQSFSTESPGRRVYFASEQVLFCVQSGRMLRGAGALGQSLAASALTEPVAGLVAEGLFYRDIASPRYGGEVGLRLTLSQRGESVTLEHRMGVWNEP